MANTITITNHGLNNGAKVILKDFVYDSDTIELNGRFFYVKVIDINTVSLYTNSSLTILQDLTGVNIDGSSQVVPVEFQATAVYDSPGGFTSDGRGILSRNQQTVTLAANTTNYTFDTAKLFSYIPGSTDAILVVNAGVYVYSDNTAVPGLTIGNFSAGDTVKLVNNGFIMGRGGTTSSFNPGSPGGPAMDINYDVTIDNTSFIGGGGGSGGGPGSGGGAGGGNGNPITGRGTTIGTAVGGGPGLSGQSSGSSAGALGVGYAGGGGGRIMPGVGGANRGGGGGAGGGGGGYVGSGGTSAGYGGGQGGSAGNAGVAGTRGTYSFTPGGGGGWGAAGGGGWTAASANGGSFVAGGAGGKAINLNGRTITYIATGTIYGAVS